MSIKKSTDSSINPVVDDPNKKSVNNFDSQNLPTNKLETVSSSQQNENLPVQTKTSIDEMECKESETETYRWRRYIDPKKIYIGRQRVAKNYASGPKCISKSELSRLYLAYRISTNPNPNPNEREKQRLCHRLVVLKAYSRYHGRGGPSFSCELELLKEVKHQNIVKLYDCFEDQKGFYLELEYCEGHDLSRYIEKRITEPEIHQIVTIVLDVLEEMNKKHYFHGDVKPENFVLRKKGDFKSVCVIDFGECMKVSEQGEYNRPYGTPSYYSYERYQTRITGEKLMKADIWALAIVVIELLIGRRCFKTPNERSVKEFKLDFFLGKGPSVSHYLKDWLEKATEQESKNRPFAKDLVHHPWITHKPSSSSSRESISSRLPAHPLEYRVREHQSQRREANSMISLPTPSSRRYPSEPDLNAHTSGMTVSASLRLSSIIDRDIVQHEDNSIKLYSEPSIAENRRENSSAEYENIDVNIDEIVDAIDAGEY